MNSKLPSIGTTIFTTMSNLAHEHHAINLAQGFPDYPISNQLTHYAKEAFDKGLNQYAPMIGMESLRNQLAQKIDFLYQNKINADSEITITPGATYAIYCALTSFLQPGDEVIVLEPAYDSYVPNILLNHAIPVFVRLSFPDYSVDWQSVYDAISSKTKAIIINSPHNPSGYIWTQEDMQELSRLISNHQLYVISDEVYEHITFDGKSHESVLKYPEIYSKSFVLFSFGKVFHNTGWKIGYCVAPPTLSAEFRKVHQFLSFSTNTPLQYALSKHLENRNDYLNLPDFFQKKRTLFLESIKDLPFTINKKSSGSYFQLLSYEQINDMNDKDFCVWLTKKAGVAAIPVSAFSHNGYDEKLIRFCFAKKDETILSASERLRFFLK